jgi:predicted adenine nucleotide alpha hydrolase (AANH) superfamily ATPase
VLRRYWNISFYFGENPNEQYVHTVRNVNTERERKKRGEIGQNLSTQDVENLASRAAFFER